MLQKKYATDIWRIKKQGGTKTLAVGRNFIPWMAKMFDQAK